MNINPYNKIRKMYLSIQDKLDSIETRSVNLQEAVARIETRQALTQKSDNLLEYEYKVFSQWGEDGIIQYLISRLYIKKDIFIEFGVEDYSEANTRFLLSNNNWSGLVIDGSEDNISKIKSSDFYWKHNLKAEKAFIDRENINKIIEKNGITGEIGILSVDIDGNDYWVWEAIDVVNPSIVIVEYNSRLGYKDALTVPYRKDFDRSKAHSSMIYFGASLKALNFLGNKKGYDLVGCNSSGVNAFFVRKDLRPSNIKKLTVEQAFVRGKFREARDENGKMSYIDEKREQQILKNLPFVKVDEK